MAGRRVVTATPNRLRVSPSLSNSSRAQMLNVTIQYHLRKPKISSFRYLFCKDSQFRTIKEGLGESENRGLDGFEIGLFAGTMADAVDARDED